MMESRYTTAFIVALVFTVMSLYGLIGFIALHINALEDRIEALEGVD